MVENFRMSLAETMAYLDSPEGVQDRENFDMGNLSGLHSWKIKLFEGKSRIIKNDTKFKRRSK